MLMASVRSAPDSSLPAERSRRWLSVGAATAALVSVLILGAGCSEPEFRYVSNTDEQTYFKVPHTWQEIDSGAIDDSFDGIENDDSVAIDVRRQLWWSRAFDADTDPAPE